MSDDRIPGDLNPDADLEAMKREIAELRRMVARPDVAEFPHLGSTNGSVFVVMPFGVEDLQVVYDDFVKPTVERRCGLQCVRGDDLFGSGVIIDDVLKAIRGSTLVIADLTGQNANVFYEVGIAHAVEVPVLLMAQSLDDVPFDVRHRRVLLYDYTPRGCKRLEAHVEEHVRKMLEISRKPNQG
jgi:hypothetical protein